MNVLNTLFVLAPGAYVSKDHRNLIVRVDGEIRVRVPMHGLSSVACFGHALMTPEAMGSSAAAGEFLRRHYPGDAAGARHCAPQANHRHSKGDPLRRAGGFAAPGGSRHRRLAATDLAEGAAAEARRDYPLWLFSSPPTPAG